MTRLFDALSFKPIRRGRDARTDGGAVFDHARADALEILQEPVVIERHRADDVGVSGEGDDPDPVVRPSLDELARHFANRLEARGLVAAHRKILGQHRLRNVEHQHDVDPAGLHLRETLAQLRPRHGDDQEREAQQKQAAQELSRARRARLPEGPQSAGRRKSERGGGSALPAELGEQRNRQEEQEQPRMRKGQRRVCRQPITQVQVFLLSQNASLPRAAAGCPRSWRRNART